MGHNHPISACAISLRIKTGTKLHKLSKLSLEKKNENGMKYGLTEVKSL